MEYTKKPAGSSGVAKVGAVLGGTALGVSLLNGGGLGNLFGGARQAGFVYPQGTVVTVDASGVPVYGGACGCYVTEKEMKLIRESSEKDAEIAQLRSEKYADSQITMSLAPVYAELGKQKDEICDLKAAIGMETERRACGDEKLLEYVKGNYIKAEKMINGRDVNYHGCKPVIRLDRDDCCCE